jgi:hypothetical protein
MPLSSTRVLPSHYQSIGSLNLSKNIVALILVNLAGVALLLGFGWLFLRLAGWIRPDAALPLAGNWAISLNGWRLLGLALGVIAIQVVVIILHEGVHGIFFWIFTRQRPVFAFRGAYAYAAVPGWYIPRGQYLVVGLAPLVALSLVGAGLMAVVPESWILPLVAFMVINAAGAAGDMALAVWLIFCPARTFAQDRGDSVTLYAPGPGALDGNQ